MPIETETPEMAGAHEQRRNTVLGIGLVALGAATVLKYGVDVAKFVDFDGIQPQIDASDPGFAFSMSGVSTGFFMMGRGSRRLEADQ